MLRGVRAACLYTDSKEPSGVGQHMLALARELAPEWSVSLACLSAPGTAPLRAKAGALGFEVVALPQPGASICLEGWLRDRRVDVLHVHAGIAWEGQEAAAAARRAGVPAVVRTEHLPHLASTTGQRAAHRSLVPQIDRLICVSNAVAHSYLDAGVPPSRIRVVRNGIHGFAAVPERLDLPPEARLVLGVGRLTEQKGFEFLIEAIADLEDTHLQLVGRGPLEPRLRGLVRQRSLDARIRLLGARADVPSLLAGADVLAMPSLFEGLPLVALEAMALGRPVVGTRVSGLSEVIVDGVTGRLVPSGDTAALARALDEVLSSPELASAWGEAGRRRQRLEFDAGRMGAETAAVYEEVLTEFPGRARRMGGAVARVRVGFVGAGAIASRHLGNLLDFDDVTVTAVADPVRERAEGFAVRSGATPYADHEAMLESEQLDALYICVPPFGHGAPELAAVDAGIPFFAEKPVAADLETAEAVAAAVAAADLVTAVGYHWRYLDVYERAAELLAANPARLVLGYWLDSTPPPSWWSRRALSGGQVIEQTTHILDLARGLVGEVTAVYAAAARSGDRAGVPPSDVDDVSTATLQFESGAVGSISSTCLLGWPHRIGLHTFSEGLAIELAEFELMVDVGRGRPVTVAEGDPFVREDRAFVDAVQGKGDRLRVPYAEALRTHRLACAVARSADEARPVELAPEPARA